jgi:hypothetical protein
MHRPVTPTPDPDPDPYNSALIAPFGLGATLGLVISCLSLCFGFVFSSFLCSRSLSVRLARVTVYIDDFLVSKTC